MADSCRLVQIHCFQCAGWPWKVLFNVGTQYKAISGPLVFCCGRFSHLANSHISATAMRRLSTAFVLQNVISYLPITCRLSVCLSVCDVGGLLDCDHIGWNSSEIISPLVSLGCSLSVDPNMRCLLQGEHPEILAQSHPPPVDLSVGDIRSQIAAE